MPELTLAAESRAAAGSGPSRRLRATGKIPAVIYGHGIQPIHVAVDGRALRAALHGDAGANTLLSLDVDGQRHLALARQLQRHPVRNTVIHVDFQVVRRDEVVTVEVPVVLVGEAIAVTRADGVVEHALTTLTVQATPSAIPAQIEVDISDLTVGENIRVRDIALPEGVATELDPDEAVVVAQGHEATAAAEAEAIEADETAAAEAAEQPESTQEPEPPGQAGSAGESGS